MMVRTANQGREALKTGAARRKSMRTASQHANLDVPARRASQHANLDVPARRASQHANLDAPAAGDEASSSAEHNHVLTKRQPTRALLASVSGGDLDFGEHTIGEAVTNLLGRFDPGVTELIKRAEAADSKRQFDPGGAVTREEIEATRPGWAWYLRLVVWPHQRLVASNTFQWVINVAILTAVLLVGIFTYVDYPEDSYVDVAEQMKEPLKKVDLVVGLVFAWEVLVKVLAKKYRPLAFFYEEEWRWNVFDLFIVILVLLPVMFSALADSFEQVKVFRLFRLARLLKLFKRVVQLQVIVRGLVRGIYSVFYVSLLVLLMLYIFGIVAMMFFSYNDPINFSSLGVAMLNLFRAATLEDWSDLMYTAWYGCELYPAAPVAAGALTHQGSWVCRPRSTYPANETTLPPGLVFLFWASFIFVVALVMLSLFVGAITLGMQQSMDEVMDEKRADEERYKLEHRRKLATELETKGKAKEVIAIWRGVYEGWRGADDPSLSRELPRWKERYLGGARHAKALAESRWFSAAVVVAILLAAVTTTLSVEPSMDETIRSDGYVVFKRVAAVFINLTFLVEVIAKLWAEGLQPWHYFRNYWNVFDLVVVAATINDWGFDDSGCSVVAGANAAEAVVANASAAAGVNATAGAANATAAATAVATEVATICSGDSGSSFLPILRLLRLLRILKL